MPFLYPASSPSLLSTGTEMVPKDVTLYMLPKPAGRKDSMRRGAAVHVRGFMGPIQCLVGTPNDPVGELGEYPGGHPGRGVTVVWQRSRAGVRGLFGV